MHVVLFEGQLWTHLAPLSLSRPVFALASGAGTLLDKQIHHLKPSRLTFWVRPEMEPFVRRFIVPSLKIPAQINTPLDVEPALLVNGRGVHFAGFETPPHPVVCAADGEVIHTAYAISPGLSHIDAMTRSPRWLELLELPRTMPQSRLADHVWDLLNWNEESIVADFISMPRVCELSAGPYHVVEPANVCVGKDVKLSPGCVLDAGKGPIIIGDGASIGPNAVLIGPCSIGHHANIAPLSQIRPGTSIGPMCRVGGEVSRSIFIRNSNKSHDGFLGDSYVGQWANLGAGTVTSNLKNTYDEVSLPLLGTETDSGRRFLGSIIGDHTKTAVGTRLMTGSYIGYSSMIASSRIAPRYVPSFTFLTDRGPEPYRRDKAMAVMKDVLTRRGANFDADDEAMVDYVSKSAKELEKV
jgi:UDP-N-acetylglucosamine diphosphorylase/glucosamine-1-phosphate N-acetyltransferase